MLETNNFHLVFKDAMASNSVAGLLNLIKNLEMIEPIYDISGNKEFGGYPVEITYENGSHIFGGLCECGGKWGIHT